MEKVQVFLKSLTGEKNILLALWRIVLAWGIIISSIFGFLGILKNLTGHSEPENLCRHNWILFILVCLIISLLYNRRKTSYKGRPNGDDLQIKVNVKDLFAIKANSYVIPTNTIFRTIMDGEYISPKSVQGAFQLKYFKDNASVLSSLISDSLNQQGIKGEDYSDFHGSAKKYPIGTVAKIDYNGKHFYWVAINDINEYGKPKNQNIQNVSIALNGLLETINTIGHCDDLALPLLGTGRAAIKEATIEKVAETIIDLFLRSSNKISRNITICVNPRDYIEGKAELEKIGKYLEYRCAFLN